MEEDIKKLKDKGFIPSVSKEIVEMLLTLYKDRKRRGYYEKSMTTMDLFMNKPNSETLDKYSRVARMNEFATKGIDGETNILKIYTNKMDCFNNDVREFIKMLKSAQSIANQITLNPMFKDMIYEYDKQELLKYKNRFTL